MYNTISMLLLLIAFLSGNLAAQQAPLQPNIDVAQFRGADDNSYIEIYYSLPEAALSYKEAADGSKKGEAVMSLEIFYGDSLWASRAWRVVKTIQDTLVPGASIVDAIRYQVMQPGEYTATLLTRDLITPDRIDSVSLTYTVRAFEKEKLALSTLELASKIVRAGESGNPVFRKSTVEVIPNAAGLYGESSPVLYYYFEVYNILQNIADDKYKVLCRLDDDSGNEVEGSGVAFRTRIKRHDNSIVFGTKNLSAIPSGTYFLVYGVADTAENILVQDRKKLFVYNPKIPLKRLAASTPNYDVKSFQELALLKSKELDQEFDYQRYIATREEKQRYKQLKTDEAKREMIVSIWNRAAKNDGTNGPTFRYVYLKRVEQADQFFKSVFRSGWKSDRGRVLILYGAPFDVERFPSTQENMPYEVWKYDSINGQGNIVFIFADRQGFNYYEQLHSNLRGELQEPNWQKLILRSVSNPGAF